MKLTNKELYDNLSSLVEISDKVTGKIGYAVSYNIRKLTNEIPEYEKMRDELINKYGEKDETGQVGIKIGSEAYEKYMSEMKQYDDIEFDINIIMVKPEDLESSDLTAKEMLGMSFMIDED